MRCGVSICLLLGLVTLQGNLEPKTRGKAATGLPRSPTQNRARTPGTARGPKPRSPEPPHPWHSDIARPTGKEPATTKLGTGTGIAAGSSITCHPATNKPCGLARATRNLLSSTCGLSSCSGSASVWKNEAWLTPMLQSTRR